SRWDALASEPEAHYYDYTVDRDGRLVRYGEAPSDYSTTVFTRMVTRIATSARQPFFVYLAPSTPHRPATRLPRDEGRFAHRAPFRPRSFDELDVSDKPWRQQVPPLSRERTEEIDHIREHQLESLQALDRPVGSLVRALGL